VGEVHIFLLAPFGGGGARMYVLCVCGLWRVCIKFWSPF
jgi:hypothetical protein